MAGVEDKTQIKITVPDNWDKIEGNDPDPSPEKGGQKQDPPAGSDKDDNKGKPAPYDKDPKWIAARQAEKNLNAIMGKVGAATIEDLQVMIDQSASVLDRVKGIDLDAVMKAAKEHERNIAYMAEKEAERLEAEETFEETIARQKAEIKRLKEEGKSKEAREQEVKQAKQVLNDFNRTVESSINTNPDLPEEYRDFTKLLMGVGNPANEIDISDPKEVKKMTGELTKVVMAFEQAVISRYRGGKVETPPMSSDNDISSEGRKPVKNLKDATRIVKGLLGVR